MTNYFKIFLSINLICLSFLLGDGYYPLEGNLSGGNVCYNFDGNRLAVGISNPTGVRVYERGDENWTQIGNDIIGNSPLSWNGGVSVTMNSAGDRVAISYPNYEVSVIDTVVENDTTLYDTTTTTVQSAQVKVFEYSGSNWVQLGSAIEIGYSETVRLSINSQGDWLAIGCPNYDVSPYTDVGKVQIYSYLAGAGGWVQVGQQINGTASNDRFGYSVSIDSVGNRVAFGSFEGHWNDNGILVYDYNNGIWSQLGSEITNDDIVSSLGEKVYISSDGNRLLVSNWQWNNQIGYVQAFEFDGSDWVTLGQQINGHGSYGNFGQYISMNSSGNLISAGGGYSEDCEYGVENSVKNFKLIDGFWVLDSENCTSGYQVIMSGDGHSLSVKNSSSIKSYKYYSRNIWYVSNTNGSNSNFGDEENPFETIQYGIEWVNNGDTVLVEPGTYYENVNFNPNDYYGYSKSLTLASRYILTDNDTTFISSTIIDGGESLPVILIEWITSGYINVIDGFTIQNGLGGTIENYHGGGIAVVKSKTHIKNCIIKDNRAMYGAGVQVMHYSGGSEFSSTLENCIFYNNEASNNAGGLSYTDASGGQAAQIINCSFYNNYAPSAAAIRISSNTNQTKLKNITVYNNESEWGTSGVEILHNGSLGAPEIVNCNIWGNVGGDGNVEQNQLVFTSEELGTNVTYSNVEGGYNGLGNLNTNPLFCNPDDNNLYLAENSPLIGAGQDGANIGAFGVGCGPTYSGPVWHVAISGSDNNIGTAESPFRNIDYALNHAELGDTVLVSPGTYFENLDFGGIDKVLISEFYYTQNDSDIHSTIIDGDSNGTVITFDDYETNSSVVSGFTIQNASESGIKILSSSPVLKNLIIKNCAAEFNGGGISAVYAIWEGIQSNLVLDNIEFYNNIVYGLDGRGGGLHLFGGQGSSLQNLTFARNTATKGGGLSLQSNGSGTIDLHNSTFYNNKETHNGITGSSIWARDVNQVNIYNSIMWSHPETGFQICSANVPDIFVSNSNISDITATCGLITYDSTCISQEPLFCSPSSNDFSLAPNSPCLGSGSNGLNMGAHGQGCEMIPGSPEDFVANINENTVTISWSSTENASFYILERDGTEIYSGTNTSFYDSGLSYGVFYEYSLLAVDDNSLTSIPLFLNILIPNPIFVPDDYSTIQEAIDSSSHTDAIYVRPGTYYENLYWSGKPASIIATQDSDNTIIDGGGNDKVFRIHSVNGGGSVLSGFTIKNGSSNEHATAGGLHITESNIDLKNLVIEENKNASDHIRSGVSVIFSSVKFINCIIQNNDKEGVYIQDAQSTPYFKNVIFTGHTSRALHLKNTDVSIDTCEFINNSGGGIWIERTGSSQKSIINKTLFSGNGESWWGGLYISGNARDIEINQCIFYDNHRTAGGADLYLNAGTPDNIGGINLLVKNSIFYKPDSLYYDNSAAIQSIYIDDNETVDSLKFVNNLFFYPNEFGVSEDTDHFIFTDNLYNTDPQFCYENENIFTISNISPAISNGDLGQNIGIYNQGCQRVMVYPGDTDNNGIVDEYDVLPIAVYFQESGQLSDTTISYNWNPRIIPPYENISVTFADANGDGIVNQEDVIGIGVNWGNTHNNADVSYISDINDPAFIPENMNSFKQIYHSLSGGGEANDAIRNLLRKLIGEMVPLKFELMQNFPNPFNSGTQITFSLPSETEVYLSIYNLLGQEVLTPIVSQIHQAGTHTYELRDNNLESGVYFFQIKTENNFSTKKMILLK